MRSPLKQMAIGMATWLPGRANLWVGATGGTVSARYCYGVWLRHMKMAREAGLDTNPRVVAELGPGDSLGIGLAALLAGAAGACGWSGGGENRHWTKTGRENSWGRRGAGRGGSAGAAPTTACRDIPLHRPC